MIKRSCPVIEVRQVGPAIHLLTLGSPDIASRARPGQFVNIRVSDQPVPLLRRPFSVCTATSSEFSVIFNIVGVGTRMLAEKRPGETLDVIGPLGHPFAVDGAFSTAIVAGGGLGVAPLPLLAGALRSLNKQVQIYLGARTRSHLMTALFDHAEVATDDGSAGYHGTVVDLLRDRLQTASPVSPKLFACGPTPMLKRIAALALELGIWCEASLECVMACGIGLCQGCPVERIGGPGKYSLVCTEGPVFETRTIRFE